MAESERQPVHTFYGGAHLFTHQTPRKLGELARKSLADHAGDATEFGSALGFAAGPSDSGLAEQVFRQVEAKLRLEPVEDLRIDFEDGFGFRPDAEEDSAAIAAAKEVARGM